MSVCFSLRQYYLVQVLRVLSQPCGTPKVEANVAGFSLDPNSCT